MLTVKDVAELKGCTERWIQKQIEIGKLIFTEVSGLATGQGGVQYRIPLSSLDKKAQLKYKRQQRTQEKKAVLPNEPSPDVNVEELSAAEREEIAFWKNLTNEWRTFRNGTKDMTKEEADDCFISKCNAKKPGLNLTRRTLYRKWKDFSEKGDIALIDKRGKHGGHIRKLIQEMWDIFEHFFLDESQKSISLCMTLTTLELEKVNPALLPLPAADTFAREVKKIPIPYIEYFRHGDKNFIEKCAPYIKRMYDNLEPNDIWVADNHTFDIMLYDGAKVLRLYLTAFMDVRTRKMMGWCVTDRPCSDATIFALKKGIEKWGVPKMLYTDNGREFLFHDFGGNGFRRKKISDGEVKPPTILKQLDIEFRTALPRNARAKGVERAFLTVKNTFSKLFEAYTGGNVLEKPERLKTVVKDTDKLKKVEEFIGFVDAYLEGWYNKQPHSGEGMNGRTPDEVFAELLIEKRVVSETQLNLMFMRWSNPMKVGKNGVTLTFYEKKLQYFDQNLWLNYFGKEVYVRYSPDDLSEVRVYDLEERFICTAKLKDELGYDATKEEVAKVQKENRQAVKVLKDFKKQKNIKTHDELELVLNKALENLSEAESVDTKILRPIFSGEILQMAACNDTEELAYDWTAALEALKKSREEEK